MRGLKKSAFFRYLIALIVFGFSMGLYHRVEVQGEESTPKFILMRLEDIGPGGQYDSLEQLGKLRAVLEMLDRQRVRYQIGVIPRWIDFEKDKQTYDRTLGDKGDPYIAAFDRLLEYATKHGAVIGMHGYTHQYGNVARQDGNNVTGIGNEFHVEGAPESDTKEYARERVDEGLAVFQSIDMLPRFWEAPHYHRAPGQDEVFRSYFGILYQDAPDTEGQRDAMYETSRNEGFGTSSLGSVYVPTPLSYIPYNRDERLILDQLGLDGRERPGEEKKLASFFYHPFLEFKHLLPVTDKKGLPVMRDGIPEYVYPDRDKTILQKLLAKLKVQGYTFCSINDYVPFTPAQTVPVGDLADAQLKLGDVTGDKQTDAVVWDGRTGEVTVQEGRFGGMRNEKQGPRQRWLTLAKQKGDRFTLYDGDGDGFKDLWVVRAGGRIEAYRSDGRRFQLSRTWKVSPAGELGELYALKVNEREFVLAGLSRDNSRMFTWKVSQKKVQEAPALKWRADVGETLLISRGRNGQPDRFIIPRKDTGSLISLEFIPSSMKWKPTRLPLVLPESDGDVLLGDFNGDGRDDLFIRRPKTHTGSVYLQTADERFQLLSRFGPWGDGGGRLIIQDFDGNGESDLGMLSFKKGTLDVALSFQSNAFSANRPH